jgi:TPR repeat protein
VQRQLSWLLLLALALTHTGCVTGQDSKVTCYRLFYADDFARARESCTTAEQQGHAYGSYLLGVMDLQGLAGPKDVARAFARIQRGAEAGISDAQRDLGGLYLNGLGTDADAAKAVSWYEKSAADNNLAAMAILGMLYVNGQGTPVDLPLGMAYIQIAAERGHEPSKRVLQETTGAAELTPEVMARTEVLRKELEQKIKN